MNFSTVALDCILMWLLRLRSVKVGGTPGVEFSGCRFCSFIGLDLFLLLELFLLYLPMLLAFSFSELKFHPICFHCYWLPCRMDGWGLM